MVTFTWCGRPSGCLSMTSTRLCTEDHDGTASMSASASMTTSGGASMTISDEACTATATKLAIANYFASPVSRSPTTTSLSPFTAASRTFSVARLTTKPGMGPRRFDGDVETHSRLVDTLRLKVVLDMLAMLLGCPFGVPHDPVGAPVIFQNLFVDQPQNPDGCPHMVRPTVGITVEHFHLFMHRRPR